MKTRPVLFSAPMVRALLAGTKTQTRRIVKPQPDFPEESVAILQENRLGRTISQIVNDAWQAGFIEVTCPYGVPGDRLWVRETWAKLLHTSPSTDEPVLCAGDKLIAHATRRENGKGWNYDGEVIAYRATSDIEFCDGDGFTGDQANRDDMPRWKPSIHMPRAFSRLTLEITDVRVERLQAISEADAEAEGIERNARYDGWDREDGWIDPTGHDEDFPAESAVEAYRALWESINGPGSWDANPWCWALTFKRVTA